MGPKNKRFDTAKVSSKRTEQVGILLMDFSVANGIRFFFFFCMKLPTLQIFKFYWRWAEFEELVKMWSPGPHPWLELSASSPDDSDALDKKLKKLSLPLGLPPVSLSFPWRFSSYAQPFNSGDPRLTSSHSTQGPGVTLLTHMVSITTDMLTNPKNISPTLTSPETITPYIHLPMGYSHMDIPQIKVTKFSVYHLSPPINSFCIPLVMTTLETSFSAASHSFLISHLLSNPVDYTT